MEHRLASQGFQIQFLVIFLLCLHFSSQKVGAETTLHLQNVYPGCKSSQNESDSSLPECSRYAFLPENSSHLSEFKEFIINETQMTDCFLRPDGNIILNSVYDGQVTFKGIKLPFIVPSGLWLSCRIRLSGPPGTVFQIQVLHFNGDTEYFKMKINRPKGFYHEVIPSVMDSAFSIEQTLNLELLGAGYFAFIFRIQAVPECLRQLQVNCSSGTKGYIETPGWSDGNRYKSDMNSCVTLHVPKDHVIMVSLISIDVERYFDYLELHKSDSCTGLQKKIYEAEDLSPTVINETGVVSFRFYSDYDEQRKGFRLLYSFHNISEEPCKLPDGKWNCNVSYYESFQQHFACHTGTFCSDGRDKVVCPEGDECGFNLQTFRGSCYRIFQPDSQTTWDSASNTCSNFGGRLAVLPGATELNISMKYIWENGVQEYVFVGLSMASIGAANEMYQNTWLWSDDTLAVYLPISLVEDVNPPYCAALKDTALVTVSCKRKMNAAFLCEIDFTSGQTQNVTQISMPTHSDWNRGNMTTCPQGHLTHTFLACDVSAKCSAGNLQESLTCSNKISPPVPIFMCRNQMEYVPYTLVCDFRSDCCDGSDEDFCVFPACERKTSFECADSKQCIPLERKCDKRSDCVDKSDEIKCWENLASFGFTVNTLQPPAFVDFTGRGNFTVTQHLSSLQKETHFQCPGEGYFLPIYVRCNEVNDCPGKEDELDCGHYTCPGFYRCRESKICLHREHLCDKVFQCPHHDDELMCNFTCPENCHCHGQAFLCTDFFMPDSYLELRYLDASGSGMNLEEFLYNTKLIHLGLSNCKIRTIKQLHLPNLQSLDLSYNNIQELNNRQFVKLPNLIFISLAYNPLMSLATFAHGDFTFSKIMMINLSGIKIQEINETFLDIFPNIRHLNMSGSDLKKTSQTGFQHLNNLQVIDLRGCPMDTAFPDIFKKLDHLYSAYTDNYKLCCPVMLPERMDPENCHAPSDEISSCDALLRADVFRVFLAFYALFALIGNLGSFIYRVFFEESCVKIGYEVFVTHLCIADFLMGVYLAIIGIADRYYYGDYLWNDVAWKKSMICKVAGFLSLVSSEVSAYLICLITLERFLVISFPHKNLRFSRRSAHIASMTVWLIGLVLALIPLLPITSHWPFYGQSGICIPLPITRKQFPGSDYAFAVIIVVNFILFLFIALGQILIYRSIHVHAVCSKDNRKKLKDMTIARRLLAVVMTDFMCWFPIGLLGVLARTGVPISSEINVAMAIFVLPFNSALNPFLYTFNVLMERRHNVNKVQKSGREGEPCSSTNMTRVCNAGTENKTNRLYSKEEALHLLKGFLEDGLLSPQQIRQQVWEIYEG